MRLRLVQTRSSCRLYLNSTFRCYADIFCKLKIKNSESLSRRLFNRVLAPDGETLSFAPPRQLLLRCPTSVHRPPFSGGIHAVEKKVSKEKAARLPLHPALLGFVGGR